MVQNSVHVLEWLPKTASVSLGQGLALGDLVGMLVQSVWSVGISAKE